MSCRREAATRHALADLHGCLVDRNPQAAGPMRAGAPGCERSSTGTQRPLTPIHLGGQQGPLHLAGFRAVLDNRLESVDTRYG